VHVEHTIALCDDGVWVLTAADGGRGRLGDLVASAARGEVAAPLAEAESAGPAARAESPAQT
jgi:hypothetical protein